MNTWLIIGGIALLVSVCIYAVVKYITTQEDDSQQYYYYGESDKIVGEWQ